MKEKETELEATKYENQQIKGNCVQFNHSRHQIQ
jgi:hypothetical protein